METKTKQYTRLEEIMAEWELDDPKETESCTIDLSKYQSTVSITSPITVSTGTNIWTSSGTNTQPWFTASPNGPVTASPKIRLEGADADIEINGVSLWATMQEISNRLNIMHTNPELETQWQELRELGEQYRKLEQHILDKQATFDRVRAMPAPEVD